MFWLVAFCLLCVGVLAGLWAHNTKKRLRKLLIGNRSNLEIDSLFDVFDPKEKYDKDWLLLVLKEISLSVSADIGMLRPTDRLSVELRPIDGFEGFDSFDWVPNCVYEKIDNDTNLENFIKYIWVDLQTI